MKLSGLTLVNLGLGLVLVVAAISHFWPTSPPSLPAAVSSPSSTATSAPKRSGFFEAPVNGKEHHLSLALATEGVEQV